MKHLFSITFLVLFCSSGSVFGQVTDRLYTPGGTLYPVQSQDGIGINEDKPDAALHIHQSDDYSTAFHINMHQRLIPGGGSTFTNPDYALRIDYTSDGLPNGTPPTQLFSVDAKDGTTRIGYFGAGNDQLMVGRRFGVYSNPTNYLQLGLNNYTPEIAWTTSSAKPFQIRNTNTGETPLTLSADGKVGIHTANFFGNHDLYVDGSVYITDAGETDHSLYIEGSSIAEEMFVKINDGSWGDFVFKKDYFLLPLNELKNFIDQNGHLPEMPTAAEVEEEGVKTGETLRLLTVKVEELTLYILQQQKEMELQQKEIEVLKTQLKTEKQHTDETK